MNAGIIDIFDQLSYLYATIPVSRKNDQDCVKNVTSEGEARRNEANKRSLYMINEHFERNFNAESASAVVFTHPGPKADIRSCEIYIHCSDTTVSSN